MALALRQNYARAIFVSIEHPDGTGYFWSGIGSKVWNGHTWSGVGNLGNIAPVKHTSDIAVQDIVFTLSGVDADIAAQLNDDVRNRNGSAWLACINPLDQSIVADPLRLVDSLLDFQAYEVGEDGTATIQITAHAGFYTFGTRDEAWTPQNQKRAYPDDTGMDMIPSIPALNVIWKPI